MAEGNHVAQHNGESGILTEHGAIENEGHGVVGGHGESHEGHGKCSFKLGYCEKGLIIPVWDPAPATINKAEQFGRALVYIIPLIYIFLGISIVADKFVTAIEVIVSKKRKVKVVSRVTGSETYVHIPIWNETVAHLTLFVLGNCAPEILLSVIEIIKNGFKEGELGPGTIIGSGAYNLFVITGICCLSVPRGRTLRLHELRIFFVTAFFLIFAYLWLYVIIMAISPNIVEVWEAFITFGFYPLFVATAYLAEKRCFGCCDRCRSNPSTVQPIRLNSGTSEDELIKEGLQSDVEKALVSLERREKRFLEIMADVKKKHPNLTMAQLRELAELEIMKEEPKSLNYYRMAASRRMAGGNMINKEKLREKIAADVNSRQQYSDPYLQVISFDPIDYSVMENVGTFHLHVIREGANVDNAISVAYETKDGSGKAGVDYRRTSGRITFDRNETLKEIPIQIIDDDEFNMDTQFYVVITNPQVHKPKKGAQPSNALELDKIKLNVKGTGQAKVTKLDDDHGGIFSFDSPEVTIDESCGHAAIKVVRNSGAKGDVLLPVVITPETAKPGFDYDDTGSVDVSFKNGITEAFIKFKIFDHGKLSSKRATLQIALGEPEWLSTPDKLLPSKRQRKTTTSNGGGGNAGGTSKLGKPRLGDIRSIFVTITENPELKRAVQDLANSDMSNFMGSSWVDQFKQAVALPSGGDEEDEFAADLEDENSPPKKRSWKDYVFHFLTIFWKVIFAFIPPAGLGQGWPAFFVCLGFIGMLIAIVGDLAMYIGCTIGMMDELTAITFVSLGTSLPDMFASRIAAMREETADAAIGHVTGGCAANIFIGIGLSWSIGSFKQALDGHDGLEIRPGSLSFSITLFFSLGSVAIFLLLIRRLPPIRGELGGQTAPRVLTALFLFILWVLYVVLSALDNYCLIATF